MKRCIPVLAILASFAALPGLAAPRVVTDIPPVQSLAARVMAGVGAPESILPPGATPHGYSMRPSEAARLSEADIIFWIGPGLTPWLEHAVSSLAADAVSVELMEAPGVALRNYRDTHDGHDDHEGHDDHDKHDDHEGHDDHRKHGDHDKHDDHDGHSDHDGGHSDRDGHDDHEKHGDRDGHDEGHAHEHHHHGDIDPHIWLDPSNARAMLAEIAARLAQVDPENAPAYAANAAAGAAEMDALAERVEAVLAPVRGRAFVTAHDAYAYFELRFAMESAGSVAVGDAASPGPARLAQIRRTIRDREVACIFIEPQIDPALSRTAAEGTGARIGVLDPLGADLEPGPALYPALIEDLAQNLADCLSGAQ